MVKSPINEQSDPGHTNSTLQSYPAGSPKNQRLIAPTPASLAPSQFDRTKVEKLRQVLDVDQLLQGTGEELTDSSIVTEESTVSENLSTMVNRVKVRGLWLAKKIYKHLHIEQGQYEMYLQEVKILKLLTRKPHWHVILLLRHYTDLENRNCLLLSPLAQMTLEAFLSQPPSQESKMLIGPWIGCLASGLAHIHAQKVKHKDIKPSNILIHGTNPVIADMGISHRFDNDSKTSGPSAGSLMYEAPEVMDEQPRGRRQDVWSMLCCYMEILAFLKGMKRSKFHWSIKLARYYWNHNSVVDWLDSLKSAAADQDELAFIQLLLDSFKTDPVERPYARGLAEQIQAICEQRPYKYIGECCVLNNTVNGSSILNYAVNVTQSALPNPEDLEKGSLLHFVANTALSLEENAFPGAFPSLDSLYRQVSNRTICSIRSAEREFLLSIVPVRLLSIPVQSCY
jgi:serine/threonine protein kinase